MSLLAWFQRQFSCPKCGSWDLALTGGCHACAVSELKDAILRREGPATRQRLPERRMAIRQRVSFAFSNRVVHDFDISFGLDAAGVVREVFCCGARSQSDLQGIVDDACIATSIALQFGARIGDMARSFGEQRPEGAASGPPASPIGAIARVGVDVEAAVQGGRA